VFKDRTPTADEALGVEEGRTFDPVQWRRLMCAHAAWPQVSRRQRVVRAHAPRARAPVAHAHLDVSRDAGRMGRAAAAGGGDQQERRNQGGLHSAWAAAEGIHATVSHTCDQGEVASSGRRALQRKLELGSSRRPLPHPTGSPCSGSGCATGTAWGSECWCCHAVQATKPCARNARC
jgi:hypothetical protein